jgi:O-antigen/teichoic acid export membrane protein
VSVLLVLRVVSCAAHVAVCLQRYPDLRRNARLRGSLVMPLLRFGGWLTVSNIVSPIMVNLDRFMIAGLLPLASVAYYVTPYELVTKLLIIPTAVLGVMFPALTAAYATDRERMTRLVDQSVRAILLLLFPATLVLVALAHEGLAWWISPTFAQQGATVLQVLAIGVLVNCAVGQVAYTAIQGAGRPDVTARVHLLELPLYLGILWLFARSFGLVGVAGAWTLRVCGDAAILQALASRYVAELRSRNRPTWIMTATAVAALVAAMLLPSGSTRFLGAGLGLVMSAAAFWLFLLQPEERLFVSRLIGRSAAPAGSPGPGA